MFASVVKLKIAVEHAILVAREPKSRADVIVHRNSIADRWLIERCPWLALKVGDKVVITTKQLDRYGGALCEYVWALPYRLGNSYGVNIDAMPNTFRSGKSAASTE